LSHISFRSLDKKMYALLVLWDLPLAFDVVYKRRRVSDTELKLKKIYIYLSV